MEILGLWAINLLVGIIIARVRGISAFGGCLWSALLGPIGWLIVAIWLTPHRPCPYCREKVHKKAVVCPHCHRDLVLTER